MVGRYAPRLKDTGSYNNMDNFIVFPYTANRLLGQEAATNFVVKGPLLRGGGGGYLPHRGYLKGLVDPMDRQL